MPSAELGGPEHAIELVGQHPPLVEAEQGRDLSNRPEFLTDDHLLLDAGPPVGYVELALFGRGGERRGLLECRLRGATSGYRAAAIVYPRYEALLENPPQVCPSRKTSTPMDLAYELQRGLRVAVLEILLAQPESVHPQQQIPSGLRHERDLVDGVGGAGGTPERRRAG